MKRGVSHLHWARHAPVIPLLFDPHATAQGLIARSLSFGGGRSRACEDRPTPIPSGPSEASFQNGTRWNRNDERQVASGNIATLLRR
jgi:hypothetical protein